MTTANPTASAKPEPAVLSDGLLRFGVQPAGGGEVVQHEIDILLLKMACEECETAHSLQTKQEPGGTMTVFATSAFLQDLAGRLRALGIANCTASIACQLWKQSSQILDTLKKNTNETPNSPSGSTSNQGAKDQTANSRKGKRSGPKQT